ncbi:hypothetical protein Q9233_002148 [Columba guinea]|nr:hypothetical protein Q9233_002148 [Columba guinea]
MTQWGHLLYGNSPVAPPCMSEMRQIRHYSTCQVKLSNLQKTKSESKQDIVGSSQHRAQLGLHLFGGLVPVVTPGYGENAKLEKAFVIQLEMTEVAKGTSLAMDCKGQARQLEMQPGLWAVVCNQLQLLLLVRPTTAMQGSAAEQKMLLLHTNLLSLGKCRC